MRKCLQPADFKNLGFTLAEVLVTLGIIGIVAALTIPILLNKYQHTVNIVKWRKAYSQFNQIALKMSEDYEVSTFEQVLATENTENNKNDAAIKLFSKYFKHLNADCNGQCKGSISHGWNCQGILVDKYINGMTGYKYLNGTSAGYWVLGYYPTLCFQTPDYVFAMDTNTSAYGRISIDVNGTKAPNVIGKDIFVLNMNDLKKVVPGGENQFYSESAFACNENAKYGGPACSAKYLRNW